MARLAHFHPDTSARGVRPRARIIFTPDRPDRSLASARVRRPRRAVPGCDPPASIHTSTLSHPFDDPSLAPLPLSALSRRIHTCRFAHLCARLGPCPRVRGGQFPIAIRRPPAATAATAAAALAPQEQQQQRPFHFERRGNLQASDKMAKIGVLLLLVLAALALAVASAQLRGVDKMPELVDDAQDNTDRRELAYKRGSAAGVAAASALG
jgi:hypothetical protein